MKRCERKAGDRSNSTGICVAPSHCSDSNSPKAAKGAFEAILLNTRGEVAEGAGSNVFVVQSGRLLTPLLSCGLLAGITRELTLEIAAALGTPHEERVLYPRDLEAADEMFITSTLKELAPITTLDGQPVGRGKPGPITKTLLVAYRARIGAA